MHINLAHFEHSLPRYNKYGLSRHCANEYITPCMYNGSQRPDSEDVYV
jgi:hypothetical protein